jgi:hypothetical protein
MSTSTKEKKEKTQERKKERKKVRKKERKKERKKILMLCSVPNHQLGILGTLGTVEGPTRLWGPQAAGNPKARGPLLRGPQGSGALRFWGPQGSGAPSFGCLPVLGIPKLRGPPGSGASNNQYPQGWWPPNLAAPKLRAYRCTDGWTDVHTYGWKNVTGFPMKKFIGPQKTGELKGPCGG